MRLRTELEVAIEIVMSCYSHLRVE